jgi:hypothetical protein
VPVARQRARRRGADPRSGARDDRAAHVCRAYR